MRFYFVIREIMVIFAPEIERQLKIELHFLTEKWNLICYYNKQNKNKKIKTIKHGKNCNIRRDHASFVTRRQ